MKIGRGILAITGGPGQRHQRLILQPGVMQDTRGAAGGERPVAAIGIRLERRFALRQGPEGAANQRDHCGFIDIAHHSDFNRAVFKPVG